MTRNVPSVMPVMVCDMIESPTTPPSMTLFGMRNSSSPAAVMSAPMMSISIFFT